MQRGENSLNRSMSAMVTNCVPEIHCMFEIVGRGGISASGLKTTSLDFVLQRASQKKKISGLAGETRSRKAAHNLRVEIVAKQVHQRQLRGPAPRKHVAVGAHNRARQLLHVKHVARLDRG